MQLQWIDVKWIAMKPPKIIREFLTEFSHTVAVPLRDGQQLQVRVLGSSMGQPVLILSPLGISASYWLPFIAPYLRRYRFYLPDFRGAGLSAQLHFNQADVFQNHMEDIQDVIQHFNLHDMLLIGYSLGATVAMHLQRAGEFGRVRRYLHIDQSFCIPNCDDWKHGLAGKRQAVLFRRMQEASELLKQYPSATYISDIPPEAQGSVVDKIEQLLDVMNGRLHSKRRLKPILLGLLPLSNRLPLTRIDDLLAYFAAYGGAGHDYRPSLKECATPITQLVGMRSALYAPEGQMKMADYAQHVEVIRFERSGHALVLSEPRKFVRVLGRFLAKGSAAKSH
jgi:non-heme chloroperoxidase